MSYMKEPGYIYIETADDRKKYAPRLVTDEFSWKPFFEDWRPASYSDGTFCSGYNYRRRIPTETNGWLPATTELPDGVNDDNSWVEVLYVVNKRLIVSPSIYEAVAWAGASHYRIIPMMPAPPPEKQESLTPADKDAITDAYYAWVSGDDCTSDEPMDAWLAGVVWEREQQEPKQ